MKRRCELERGLVSEHFFEARAGVDAPQPVETPQTGTDEVIDPGYLVVCWNDPVNLTEYVTHVFQRVFGWERPKAEKHMLEVHEQGKSILTREGFEKAEFHVHQLQNYHLNATMERDV
jgi:ATP-dependent Clp protease adaptor protein ClpS